MIEFVNGSDAQYALLQRSLSGNIGVTQRFSGINLNDSCTPSECYLDITALNDGNYFVRFVPVITCTADVPDEVTNFLSDGFCGSYGDAVCLLRDTLAPLAIGAAVTVQEPLQAPVCPETNNEPTHRHVVTDSESTRPMVTGCPEDISEAESNIIPSADYLFGKLSDRIVGHSNELREISRLVADHLSKVAPQRPLTLLIAGKPGIGKTLTGEAVHSSLESCGYRNCKFIRVVLSEFKDKTSVARFTGANPGYVGYGDATVFDPLRYSDQAVILFDEIERTHPDVIEALLNIMDRGELQLSSSSGGKTTISFKKSILIFCSNISVNEDDLVGLDTTGIDTVLRKTLDDSFITPFVSRLKYCAYYSPFTTREKLDIIASCLSDVAREYGLHVRAVDYSALKLFSDDINQFGARILKNAAERLYGDAFAQYHRDGAYEIDLAADNDGAPIITVVSTIPVPSATVG